MWKYHPLVRFVLATFVIALTVASLFLAGLLDSQLWADSHTQPKQSEGVVHNIKLATYSSAGRFDLITSNDTQTFDVNSYITTVALREGQNVRVTFSPNLKHVYSIQILTLEGNIYEQDRYEPNALFQPFQTLSVLTLLGLSLVLIVATLYAGLTLADWWLKPRQQIGGVLARLEQADFNVGFGIVVRPFYGKGKSRKYRLSQSDFLLTDGAEWVQLSYTPFLHYVKQIKVLTPTDLPATDKHVSITQSPNLIHCLSRWHYVFFVYRDLAGAIILLAIPLLIVGVNLPVWSDSANPINRYHVYERVFLPSFGMIALIMAIFMGLRFLRKWREVRRPKKLTEGPVLSKWRVNGASNENRRQIVVADGGLEGGSEAVHKFDVPPQVFDEIKVGDVVKIEHTPRLRYILRMEVTGHQELVHSV